MGTLGSFILNGSNFTNVVGLKIGDVPILKYHVLSDTQISGAIPDNALDGPIKITNYFGETVSPSVLNLTHTGIFVSGISPLSGASGQKLIISGRNFQNITSVLFSGGISASYNIVSSEKISVTIPKSGLSGNLTILSTGRTKTGYSDENFVFFPVITGFNPASGNVNVVISIFGYNFTNAIQNVYLNNIAFQDFAVHSHTGITGRIPSTGNIIGKLSLTGSISGHYGTVSKSEYSPFLAITGISGLDTNFIGSGNIGDQVEVLIDPNNGLQPGFRGATYTTNFKFVSGWSGFGVAEYLISFNNIFTGLYLSGNAGRIITKIPTGATTGPVKIYKNKPGLISFEKTGYMIIKNQLPQITAQCIPNVLYTGTTGLSGLNVIGQNFYNVTHVRLTGYTPNISDGKSFDISGEYFTVNTNKTMISVTGYAFTGDQVATGYYNVEVNALEGTVIASGISGVRFITGVPPT